MARVTMLAMPRDGLITLQPPPPAPDIPRRDRPARNATRRPRNLRGQTQEQCIARHHNFGYKTLVGAQMSYAVHDRGGWPLAMLGFSTARRKLAPATASSDGRHNFARRTSHSSSTTRGS